MTGPPLELTSTSNGNPVYREQVVTFTCVTRGSPTLAWSSDDYIGEGALVELLSIDTQGTARASTYNNNTIATLTCNNGDDQTFVLESTLHILVLPVHSTSTVSCHNVGQNLREDIMFRVFGKKILFVVVVDLVTFFFYLHA